MSRRVVWLQLIIGWLPLWALLTLMIMSAHGAPMHTGAFLALRMVACAAVLGVLVQRLVESYPWPSPMRLTFVIAHLGYSFTYAAALIALNSVVESLLVGALVLTVGPSLIAFFMTGLWLYVMIAGVSYTSLSTERAARAEGNAARAQLAALRAQLHPHFLFNALHSVIQLIPREPARAADAAEQLAGLLRTSIEEDRDIVSLADELSFVERYLAIERMRFGDRLRVTMEIDDGALECTLPVYALQTLVENAVRHGAAPQVEPTDVVVAASCDGRRLQLTVADTGAGVAAGENTHETGTGLKRLRERLGALYGDRALLRAAVADGGGYRATLDIPYSASDE